MDFTPYLIEVAKTHFERPPARLYHLHEVCEFVETADLMRFTKVLCFGAFQCLRAPTRLLAALRARSTADRLFLGNLPDLERIDRFPNAIAPGDVRRNDAPLGVLRSKDEIRKLAADNGWHVEFHDVNPAAPWAAFRFHAALTPRA